MQISAGPNAPPHLFFLGLRAPMGGQGPAAQRVGAIALKQTIHADGTVGTESDVLKTDEPYAGAAAVEPCWLEADLATAKPELDVIAVKALADDGTLFGSFQVDRGGGFGVAQALTFGWLPRKDDPRKALAGTGLDTFVPNGTNLPVQFKNAFFNGHPATGEAPLGQGHVVRFTPLAGAARSVQIPVPPGLAIKKDGAPVSPPVAISLVADTVVYDLSDAAVPKFLVTWRGTFLWEDRLELATLEVS